MPLQLHSSDVISADANENCVQELSNDLPLLWTACVNTAYSGMQSVQGSVCRCFQDLE